MFGQEQSPEKYIQTFEEEEQQYESEIEVEILND